MNAVCRKDYSAACFTILRPKNLDKQYSYRCPLSGQLLSRTVWRKTNKFKFSGMRSWLLTSRMYGPMHRAQQLSLFIFPVLNAVLAWKNHGCRETCWIETASVSSYASIHETETSHRKIMSTEAAKHSRQKKTVRSSGRHMGATKYKVPDSGHSCQSNVTWLADFETKMLLSRKRCRLKETL